MKKGVFMRKQIIKIGNRNIGENYPCFIIAEVGINHNGDINIAKKMIDVAIECGVDAVKFQTFKAEDFISDKNEKYTYYSNGKKICESMYEMFKRYEFSKEEWIEISNYCVEKNIEFFSTPQNSTDLDFLLNLYDMPCIKVGADDLTNLELMKYYASKQKPMIISSGMAYASEIEDAVETIRKEGNENIIVLHCISSYPAEAEEVNLNKIKTIEKLFDLNVGFSDHTIGTVASVGATVLGVKVIEKHFTLDKNLEGPDHWFSSEPKELKQLVESVRYIEIAMGTSKLIPTSKELEMRKIARRSIVASRDISEGEVLKAEDIVFKRPGTGIEPKNKKFVIGQKVTRDIKKNELIKIQDLR